MKKPHRKYLGLVIVILLGIPLFAAGQKDKTSEPIDWSCLQNGIYLGEAKNWPVAVNVEIHVVEQKIAKIVITRHREGRGERAETIVNDIIAAQSLDVDAVSKATLSSKTILQAVKNALKKAIED
ncbi:MAG: FMN-binding protein [Treponema sp.]|jgi:uncharacterized protein with FMN-binding domain|nr:FMN-binding protein [Treponema sp.]